MTINFNPFDVVKHDIIIETGTYNGSFVEKYKNNYKTFHTIEIVNQFYNEAVERFKTDSNVICHLGDSPVVIGNLLKQINEPVTFWLDAHYQGGTQSHETKVPLHRELDVIKTHHIKEHMIMIDDVRLFENTYGTNKTQVEAKLREINPEYNIQYMMGAVEGDVLVAFVN
jgi:S-adenosylhomocysteine hydrolase